MEFEDILANYPDAVLLKKGGQKAAYKIDHPQYGAAVVKVGHCPDKVQRERIRREVSTQQQIDSKYYPKNYELEIRDDYRFVIVEEYIESDPLSKRIVAYDDAAAVVDLITQMAEGLSILWDRRIVHRDVKPDNTLIRPNGDPVIIDLGIARLLDLESATPGMQRGPLTWPYSAPEQGSQLKGLAASSSGASFLPLVKLG